MALDKDDIKQLIAILQKGLSDDNDTEDMPDKQETKKTKRTRITKNIKPNKKQTKTMGNLFESMPERTMHKEDVLIDQKLRKFAPTQRSRNFKPINVNCRVCGKKESVNPSLIESVDRYKCNKCSSSAG
jgi:hypothetical protein